MVCVWQKTYEFFSWLKQTYSILRRPAETPLQTVPVSFLEKVGRDLFAYKNDPERKLVYANHEHWKTLKVEDKGGGTFDE